MNYFLCGLDLFINYSHFNDDDITKEDNEILPTEIITHIISYLDNEKTLFQVGLVNKQWLLATQNRSLSCQRFSEKEINSIKKSIDHCWSIRTKNCSESTPKIYDIHIELESEKDSKKKVAIFITEKLRTVAILKKVRSIVFDYYHYTDCSQFTGYTNDSFIPLQTLSWNQNKTEKLCKIERLIIRELNNFIWMEESNFRSVELIAMKLFK